MTQKRIALAILAVVLIANAVALAPEIAISRVDLNDNVFHFGLIQGITEDLQAHKNPLDHWYGQWGFGYRVLHTYQSLPHFGVAAAYFALGKPDLMAVFSWVRYLSVVLLPASFFACAWLLGLGELTAAAAALLAPLISTPGLYGIEYGSFVWAGNGLFTQAVACHFFLLAIGLGWRGMREEKYIPWAGLAVALTFLSHFIYGWMAAVTLCLLLRRTNWLRLLKIGAVAFALCSWQLWMLWRDRALINHSHWEASWKWDSFGAPQVLRWLVRGELLDHGRHFPVLTILALFSLAIPAMVAIVHTQDKAWDCERFKGILFATIAAIFWLAVFCGRPAWGGSLDLIGATSDTQLHRVIGGAQVFMLLLAAVGLGWLWSLCGPRIAAAAVLTALLLYPAIHERAVYLANNARLGRENLAMYQTQKNDVDWVLGVVRSRGGRAFAGMPGSWGAQFKVGYVPFYAFLSRAEIPAVSFLYHAMSIPSDNMYYFNEFDLNDYHRCNVRTVIAPADRQMPWFLVPIARVGRFQVLAVR